MPSKRSRRHTNIVRGTLFSAAVFFLVTLWACSPAKKADTPTKPAPTLQKIPSLATGVQRHTGNHGIALHGLLKYAAQFKHFAYVKADAPKGGILRLGAVGSFDSLNQFIIRGKSADGLERIYDTLLVSSADEPYSKYGLIAKKIIIKPLQVDYLLNEAARFSDGVPLTAADVQYSFNLLRKEGNPLFKAYYRDVKEVRVINDYHIRFIFSQKNRELPSTLGEFPILPKHYWQDKSFTKTTLKIPIGSGPYIIAQVDAAKNIHFQRNKNYWAKDLPVNVGRYNFDRIQISYYRSEEVLVEALKGARLHWRLENSAKRWHKAYQPQTAKQAQLTQALVLHKNPVGMQGLVFNLRKKIFQNRLVRQALQYAFDFNFINRRFMHSAYQRTNSYFENSALASRGLPSIQELALLRPFADKIPQEVFTQPYKNPESSGDGFFRDNKKHALDLLNKAGWQLKNNTLQNKEGQPFVFEVLMLSKSMERIIKPFALNLEKIGITVNLRLLETSQYIYRVQNFDFDMVTHVFGQSLSPGNEQRNYWSSASADKVGSYNLAGIKNPVVDYLIERIIKAADKEQLRVATQALDRVLLWNFYVIPHFHNQYRRIVYWRNIITHPEKLPLYGLSTDIDSWYSAKSL